MQDLFSKLLNRQVDLEVMEDNEATIAILATGYSSKLAYLERTQTLNIAWVSEFCADPSVRVVPGSSGEQLGDAFTKALAKPEFSKLYEAFNIK